MDAHDVREIIDIMSDQRVMHFFRQPEMVELIMNGQSANNDRLINNGALNSIIRNTGLMAKIMKVQDRLSAQFEARDRISKERFETEVVAHGFDRETVGAALDHCNGLYTETLTYLRKQGHSMGAPPAEGDKKGDTEDSDMVTSSSSTDGNVASPSNDTTTVTVDD